MLEFNLFASMTRPTTFHICEHQKKLNLMFSSNSIPLYQLTFFVLSSWELDSIKIMKAKKPSLLRYNLKFCFMSQEIVVNTCIKDIGIFKFYIAVLTMIFVNQVNTLQLKFSDTALPTTV